MNINKKIILWVFIINILWVYFNVPLLNIYLKKYFMGFHNKYFMGLFIFISYN